MARLLIHVEGPTEETFVNEVLGDYLLAKGYQSVAARRMGNARFRNRGGNVSWASAKREIGNHLKEDPLCVATTMVDFYGLPEDGERAWPGRKSAKAAPIVESTLLNDFAETMGKNFDRRRFVPFLVMHEFEGLLFSDCEAFSKSLDRPDLHNSFQDIRSQFTTPEDINDSPLTAPSKRIVGLLPEYEKPISGSLAILEIGLDRIRRECPHFDDWLNRLYAAANCLNT